MALARARWIFGLLTALAAVLGLRALVDVPRGLRADYFLSLEPGGAPARNVLSPEVSTAALLDDWNGALPPLFRARWYGYLTVLTPGLYTFSTTSDDGSALTVGDELVVDNRGIRGTTTRTGQIRLERGAHPLLIEYVQAGGFYEMEWAWARDGGSLARVPGWRLSPGRVSPWTVLASRALDLTLASLLALLAAAVAIAAFRPEGTALRVARRRPALASLAFFVLAAVVETWPLASDPARLSRHDNADTALNQWTIAWFAHQAPRAPLQLYDANIFYPERSTLAYSEAMIVQAAMAAPLLWLGASPVLAYNLLLLAGFALTGWTTSLVVSRWTGDWTAGLVSGVLAGINAHTLTRLPHLQAQHGEFLPLALYALDALLREPRIGHALRLALWFVLQGLTSVYLLVFTTFALAFSALSRPGDWLGARLRAVAPRLGLAALVAVLAMLPFLLPYWRVYSGQGLTRSLADAAQYSASFNDYVTTPGRIHSALWSDRWASGTALFPGLLGLTLAALACVSGSAFRDARARMCLAFGAGGFLLSFGARLPGYETLYNVLPLLHAIRAPVRFGYLGIVAVALLAGFGTVWLRRHVPVARWGAVASVLVLVALVEPLAAPLGLSRYSGIPPIYGRLRDEPRAVVIELPLPHPRAVFHNARALLNSTQHWKPMLNGYSGFVPQSYRRHYEQLAGFPSADSAAVLASLDVTHAFVHADQLAPAAVEELDRLPGLELIAQEGGIRLYRVNK